jgi:hypothetical protein
MEWFKWKKHLLSKREALSSSPSATKKKKERKRKEKKQTNIKLNLKFHILA